MEQGHRGRGAGDEIGRARREVKGVLGEVGWEVRKDEVKGGEGKYKKGRGRSGVGQC